MMGFFFLAQVDNGALLAKRQLAEAEDANRLLREQISKLQREAQEKNSKEISQKNEESSRLEQLLAKTLSRVSELENSVKAANEQKVEQSKPKNDEQKKTPEQTESKHDESDVPGSDSDESDEAAHITTASGQKVHPLIWLNMI